MAGEERLLSVRDVSRMSGLSIATIYRWVRWGRFPAPYRVGARAVRWSAAEVQAWISAQKELTRCAS